MHKIENINIVQPPHPNNGDDVIAWSLTSDRSFTLASAYASIAGYVNNGHHIYRVN
jgi:hypothetical protein